MKDIYRYSVLAFEPIYINAQANIKDVHSPQTRAEYFSNKDVHVVDKKMKLQKSYLKVF